jgi:hypothetical protein
MMARPGGAFGPPAVDGMGNTGDSNKSRISSTVDGLDLNGDMVQVLLVSTSANGLSLTTTWWFLNNKLDIPRGTLQTPAQAGASTSGVMVNQQSEILKAAKSIVQRYHIARGEVNEKEESDLSSWIILPTSTLGGPQRKGTRIGRSAGDQANIHTSLHFLTPEEVKRLKTMDHIMGLTTGQVMEAILTTNNEPSNTVQYDTTTLSSLALGMAYVQTQTQNH